LNSTSDAVGRIDSYTRVATGFAALPRLSAVRLRLTGSLFFMERLCLDIDGGGVASRTLGMSPVRRSLTALCGGKAVKIRPNELTRISPDQIATGD
jgi:hypothetical protein